MRAAEKEVEFLEKQEIEEAEKEGRILSPCEIKLPMFKELQAKKRAEVEKKFLEERAVLEKNVLDIDQQIKKIQKALRDLDGVQPISSFFRSTSDLSESMVVELANLIAKSRSHSMVSIADEFTAQFPGKGSKKAVCDKIELIGIKEKRVEEGDITPIWYLRSDYKHMLTKETYYQLEEDRKERLRNLDDTVRKRKSVGDDDEEEKEPGAIGPDGDYV